MTIETLRDLIHHRVVVGDIAMHYAEAGSGKPVLLLAGWPQDWFAWRYVAPILVAEGRRVIMLDPRGFGESDKPSDGYDLDTVATDVHDLLNLLKLDGAGGVDIVSHDVGSWIAYALACGWPDDVRSVVLSEMTIQQPDTKQPIPDDSSNIATWHFAFNRLLNLPEALVAGRERLFLDWMFDHKTLRPEAIDEDAREHYARAFSAPGAARAGFDYYRALFSTDGLQRMADRLARPLTMPVLAIGATGGVGPRLAESLYGAASDLHQTVLNSGHYLPEEAPSEFAGAVIGFWRTRAKGR